MAADQAVTALLNHIATLLAQHNSGIAETAIAELNAASNRPVVKPPQHVAQCSELDTLLDKPLSPTLAILASARHAVHWADSGGAAKPNAIQRRLAFAELIGPTGMIENARCRVGLFLQCPETAYPVHKHAAEELYLVLSGTAHWQKESMDSCWHAPGTFIHHASWQTHAMTTSAEPLLAIWCWSGDIRFEQYEIVA